jgi:hypothetical protein
VTANGDAVTSVTLTSGGAAMAATVAGSPYPIIPSAAVGSRLSNYLISYVSGSLNVNLAPLSITAGNQGKTYGQSASLNLSDFTVNGLVKANGDTVTGVTLACSGPPSTATVVGSPYPIVPSTAEGTGLNNYSITYVNGAFTVKPAPLTITANNQNKTYGQAITLGTTAYTTAGLVIANGDTVIGVTLTSAGAAAAATVSGSPYSIAPSAPLGNGLSNYIVSYVNGKLTVNPAPLTITASNQTKSYGQALALGTTAFASTGLLNSDTVTAATLTSAGAPKTATVTGSPYTIVVSGAVGTGLSNYIISYVNGKLTVTPAPLTITANNQTKTYGRALTLGTAAFVSTGLLNADTVTGVTLTSAGAYATATVAGSPYIITPSAAVGTGLGSYTITYVFGHLTVNAAPLTITANNQSKTYGQVLALGSKAFTTTGLVSANLDTVASVTLTSAGTPATAVATKTPYPIVPSAAAGTGLSNYTITYANGNLNVNQAPLTITASNRTKTYGQALAPGTTAFTSSGLLNSDKVNSVTLTSAGAAATAGVAGSPYSIVPSAAAGTGLASYIIEYVNGNLTVAPATLTVTASNETKKQGSPNPTLAYTMTGFKNGDTQSKVTSGQPTLTTSATTTSPTGTYPIKITAGKGAGARTTKTANYQFEFVNGTLTVD